MGKPTGSARCHSIRAGNGVGAASDREYLVMEHQRLGATCIHCQCLVAWQWYEDHIMYCVTREFNIKRLLANIDGQQR